MNNTDYNDKLFQKMSAEQKKYRGWLLTLPPEEILHHAYEYSVREDILISLDGQDLTDAQAKALLKSPTPLADVVRAWNKSDPRYMEDIRDTLENTADDLIQRERQRSRNEGAR